MANCKYCGTQCPERGEHDNFLNCKLYTERKLTNADRIRSMNDEELAEWILQLADCGKENVLCNPTEYKLSGKCNGQCLQGRLDWLKAETEGTE